MADSVDWSRLLKQRRLLAHEPDEESIRRMVEHWRDLLAQEGNLSDELLDEQLVKLLERIHHAL